MGRRHQFLKPEETEEAKGNDLKKQRHMDTGSFRPNKMERNGKIHEEQVRKVLKFIEMKGVLACDDISSSPSAYKMTITITISDGIVADATRARQTNEALERAFGEYMVSPLQSEAHEKYGHDTRYVGESPTHFCLNFLKPDVCAPGSTMTVVCRCRVPQLEFIRICYRHKPVVFFSDDDPCLSQCVIVSLSLSFGCRERTESIAHHHHVAILSRMFLGCNHIEKHSNAFETFKFKSTPSP